jgi:hypothetical protein
MQIKVSLGSTSPNKYYSESLEANNDNMLTGNQNFIVKYEHKKSWMTSELYLNSCLTILQAPCTVNRNIMRNLEDHNKFIQI